jgi:hypothetical protein
MARVSPSEYVSWLKLPLSGAGSVPLILSLLAAKAAVMTHTCTLPSKRRLHAEGRAAALSGQLNSLPCCATVHISAKAVASHDTQDRCVASLAQAACQPDTALQLYGVAGTQGLQ